jgi:hypothetical protein
MEQSNLKPGDEVRILIYMIVNYLKWKLLLLLERMNRRDLQEARSKYQGRNNGITYTYTHIQLTT